MATEIETRRARQIGGCVTEIRTGTTRIFIDFGEELPGSRQKKPLAPDWDTAGGRPLRVGAVFFTHYHGDHVGRFAAVPDGIPLYMSALTRDVLDNIRGYLAQNLPRIAQSLPQPEAAQLRAEAAQHARALQILRSPRVRTFRPHEARPISIGDITVTPVWVDHSAGDACMFLIETPDRRILHTGDFRGHGLHGGDGKAVCDAVRRLAAVKKIDVLLIEGTMMSRRDEKPFSEAQLLANASQYFLTHRHVFLVISSTNLDSLATFYCAARENGLPMYAQNPYVAAQIETLGQYAHEHWGLPDMRDVARVSGAQRAAMRAKGFVAVIRANAPGEALVRAFADCRPSVVYSLWQGYAWRRLDKQLCVFLDFCRDNGVPVVPPNTLDRAASAEPRMHTSGHADPALLADVINAAAPDELLPIHTENTAAFLRLAIPAPLKDRLRDRLLQEGRAAGYSEAGDHRCLRGEALAKFLPGHSHHAFVRLVQSEPELCLCFRGNSGNAAVIYYKNQVAFFITSTGLVKFNFRHAHYLPPAGQAAQRERLAAAGYVFSDGRAAAMPPERAAALTPEALRTLFRDGIRPMIDASFAAKGLAEKAVQQRLFLACRSLRDGYCIYDLEFSQPYGRRMGCENQPDMLAVRFDAAGRPAALAFIEVKSTPAALTGPSGLSDHVEGMEHYPPRLLPVRRRDACRILNQYIRLGLLEEAPPLFEETSFANLPQEVLLVVTGADTLRALHAGGVPAGYKRAENLPMAPDGAPLPMEVWRRVFLPQKP